MMCLQKPHVVLESRAAVVAASAARLRSVVARLASAQIPYGFSVQCSRYCDTIWRDGLYRYNRVW